jgi:DNA repair protein RadA/Sms
MSQALRRIYAVAKTKQFHECGVCGATSAQWTGKCAECGEWNSMQVASAPAKAALAEVVPMSLLEEVKQTSTKATGVAELDRVLGGGLTEGSVTLLGGEPGIGKSTLALQLAATSPGCIYVSGEESVQQVAQRARRLGLDASDLLLLQEVEIEKVVATVRSHSPKVVIVDSIQTVAVSSLDSGPGTVAQVRAVANELVSLAKSTGVAIVIIGHVTKEGALAGPRTLEHLVDTVLEFEGDRHYDLRLLSATKHRFGPTGEVGVLQMTETGMVGVSDPSGMFLDDRRTGIPGSVVVPALGGRRPMLVEVQALAVPGNPNQCRRVAQGLDYARLSVVLAVLEKHAGVTCKNDDVYASVVGGVKLDEPATDLAVALAIASSKNDAVIPEDVVAIGEVGLGGEVRRVSAMGKRLAEASRMGFRRAIVPLGCSETAAGLEIIPVDTIKHALGPVAKKPAKLRTMA